MLILFVFVLSTFSYIPLSSAANYTITIVIDSNSANVAGCRVVIDGVSYQNGATVVLSSSTSHACSIYTPSGWGWLGWFTTTTCQVSNPNSQSTTLTVSGNGFFGATFGPLITVYTSPSAGGTISIDNWGAVPPHVDTYINGQTFIFEGYASNIIANPNTGYSFSSWSSSGSMGISSSTSATLSWNPQGPGTITANFQLQTPTYDVTILLESNDNSAGARIKIDGVSHANNEVVSLNAGVHTCEAVSPANWGWISWFQSVNTPVTNPSISSTTFMLNGNGVLGADFGPIVTFYTSPSNGGTITVNYWGANPTFSETYSNGQSAVIKGPSSNIVANPASGYTFSSWSSTGTMQISSTTSANTLWIPQGPGTATANFQQQPTPYSVLISMDSTADSAGCRTIIDGTSYRNGNTAYLTAGAHTCSVSYPSNWGWLGWFTTTNCQLLDPNTASTTLTVTGSGTIGGTFGPIVTFTMSPFGSHITAGLLGQPSTNVQYSNGQSGTMRLQTYSIQATPVSGYRFVSWSSNGCGNVDSATSSSTTWTPTGPGTLTANFEAVPAQLTVSSSHGSPNPSIGSHTYNIGSGVTCSVTSPVTEGGIVWICTGWTGSGSVPSSGSGTSTSFTITKDSAITWNWVIDDSGYSLGVNTVGQGTVTKNPNQATYTSGSIVTLTATAASGWIFSGWSGAITGSANPTTITMNSDKTITATFTQIPPSQYPLTVNVAGSGSVSKNPNQATYTSGTVVTLTALAASGWTFSGWSGAISGSTNPATVTIDSDKTVTATFTQNNQKPIARLSVFPNPPISNIRSNVEFYGTSSSDPEGSALSYYFDFGDGQNSGWLNYPTVGAYHAYSQAGAFNAALKVRDISGLESDWSDSIAITILGTPKSPNAVLEITPSTQVTGQQVKFDASGSNDPDGTVINYGFDFGDGSSIQWSTNPIVYHTYSTANTYSVRVKVEDNSGLESWSAIKYITITQATPTKAAKPTINPPSGTYSGPLIVTIDHPNYMQATIRYTVDGSTPTSSSETYSNPGIVISSSTTIKARAFMNGLDPSDIDTSVITLNSAKVSKPTITPSGTSFTGSVTLNIECNTLGAVIRYTTNGEAPTSTSNQYTGPITLSSTTTIRAKAFSTGYADSDETIATFTKSPPTSTSGTEPSSSSSSSPSAPSAPSLSSPSNGLSMTSGSVSFTWSTPLGATQYQIEINGPTYKLETVTSTYYSATLNAGSYSWRVKAGNSAGWSSWSPSNTLTLTSSSSPSTPNVKSLSVIIDSNPPIKACTIPSEVVFTAIPSGGAGTYSISWKITGPSGTITSSTNPLRYTFKFQGNYVIQATVTCSGNSEMANAQTTVTAVGTLYEANFKLWSGNTIAGNDKPMVAIEYDNQPNKGYFTVAGSEISIKTDIRVSFNGATVPDWISSLLQISSPWYSISVSDNAGSVNALDLVQLSAGTATRIDVTLPRGTPTTITPNSYTYRFTASATSVNALAGDVVSSVFTFLGVAISANTIGRTIFYAAVRYLAETEIHNLSQLLFMSSSQQLQWLTHVTNEVLTADYLLSLAAAVGGEVAVGLMKTALQKPIIAAQILSNLGLFLGAIGRGDLYNEYYVTEVKPMLYVAVDPPETIQALLNTPNGSIGYYKGIWKNDGNITGFYHTDIIDNNYGFGIPVTDELDTNLTISCSNGRDLPYNVTVNWNNQNYVLDGKLSVQEPVVFAPTIEGTTLKVTQTNESNNLFLLAVIGIAFGLGLALTLIIVKRNNRRGIGS